MIASYLSELAFVLGAELIEAKSGRAKLDEAMFNKAMSEGKDIFIEQVVTDTRVMAKNSLFVALKGEQFDGHDFVEKAAANGAVALLVSRPCELNLPQLIVQDTKVALGQLGAWVKAKTQTYSIALTGSCGKTTVKEMLAAILSLEAKTLYTQGNFNNDIGVPLTLLRLEPSDKFSVIELGANHIGEIAYTAQLVKPDIALVTNLAAAHLEGFGSLEGVTQAKGEIFQGLKSDGVAIVNLDSWGGASWEKDLAHKKLITTSVSDPFADFYAKSLLHGEDGCYQFVLVSSEGEYPVQLSLPGKHNVANALLAIAAASQCHGITQDKICQGLADVGAVKGRGAISFPRQGLRLIDDSYNASLAAMIAAIDLLDTFAGEKIIILADMGEMGEYEQEVHLKVATHLAQSQIQTVITYGKASAVISAHCAGLHFDDKNALNAYVVELMKTKHQVSVLVKGANGMKMWEVVQAIEEAATC